jgi:hypothetical protein
LPAAFAAFDTILFHQRVGIFENMASNLEADSVFALIAAGLGFVPFKPNHGVTAL